MGLFDKLFGHGQSKAEKMIDEEPLTVAESPPCPHSVLSPRWDSAADLGNKDKATAFVCEACGETFSPEEARLLRETEVERLEPLFEPAQGGSDEPPQTDLPPPDVPQRPPDMR
jgi:hypothetical protein